MSIKNYRKYTKDISISYGEDKVTIKMIQINGKNFFKLQELFLGTTYASTSCQPCPLGHYSNILGNYIELFY